jgi:hypothetical protein
MVAMGPYSPSADETRVSRRLFQVLAFLGLCWPGLALADEGRLRTNLAAAVPESRTVEVRALDARLRDRTIEALLSDALRDRGFNVEVGAPLVVGYRATGVFSTLQHDSSWLRLQGSIGSSSAPSGYLAFRLPDFDSSKPKSRPYSIELRAEDQPGTLYWEASAVLDSASSNPAQVAREMLAAALDRWGATYYGPLLR